MGWHRPYKPRKYAVGQALLTLRYRTKLTQIEVATLVGVSKRSVLNWEGGQSYPKEGHLRQLIALFVAKGAFTPGDELAEAERLWERASQDASQRLGPFDQAWFGQLLANRSVDSIGELRPPGDSQPSSAAASHSLDADQHIRDERDVALGLPFRPTPCIGRDAELAEIARILGDPACRLLTLLGPGGVGKTRLALEVAARQTASFSDGVAFVALASVGAPNQIVSAIGDALNLSFAGRSDPATQLLDYLRQRHMLLVFDNFEHLLAGADLLSAILGRAPNLTLLVTSRERLNLQAEWLFDVDGLAFPSEDPHGSAAPQSLADMADYSAVQLFVQRATQVKPRLAIDEATLTTSMRICQHVAGMPLAIELAAAAMRLMPMGEIERQIRARLDVLATTLRDVPARHRSMRAVFDHSWNLLSEREQALFSHLAVFRGGWTAEAAEQVAGATLPALTALLDKSVVRSGAEPQATAGQAESNPAGAPRFVMLEPLREYALEQLATRGEAVALQRAHADYYLALAEAAAAQWDTPTADALIKQLDHEHDNFRAVLQWACDGGDHVVGLQIAGALRKFWQSRGCFSEGRLWLEQLLAIDERNPNAASTAIRLRATHTAAWLASDQHDYTRATELFDQSLALRRELGEVEGEIHLLAPEARLARAVGQYGTAIALLEDRLMQYRTSRDRGSWSTGGLGLALYELGLALREQGDFARATSLFAECVAFHREIGDREGMAIGLLGLSDVARDQGDVAGVRAYAEESLAMLRQLGVQWAIGFVLNNLAVAAWLERDLAHASTLVAESVALFRSLRADGSLVEALITLGQIARAQGGITAAREALAEALQLALAIGPRLMVTAALEGLASVMVSQGHAEPAARLLAAASTLRAQMRTPVRPVDRNALEHALATTRSALGADVFAAIWSEAETLPLGQILGAIPSLSSLSAGPASLDPPPATLSAQPPPLLDWDKAIDVKGPLLLWQAAPEQPADVPAPDPVSLAKSVDDKPSRAPNSPALRRPQQPIHNLPAPVADFIGREADHTLVLDRLRDPVCRLVTLVGLGGIGKTTLALQAAQSLLPDIARQIIFPHGAFFVSLAGIESPTANLRAGEAHAYSLLATAIAGALQLTFSGAEPPHTQLANVLREQRLLLILDNCEHLPATAGFIADLLRQAPDLTILATSRTRLNLRGEHIVELSGLSVPSSFPPADAPASAPVLPAGDEMIAFSALQLFRARARAIDPHFAWTPENAAAATRICTLFDGLPLGIELTAQMVRLLPCPEIVRELETSLDTLATSQQDMPARHRSLRAVFDHSWRLLAEDTQRILGQLSVFRGGFSREGAAQVAGATLPLLATLLDASLVRLLRERRVARYEMQEIVRQYAAERLAADEPGARSIRTRHSHYYLGLLERAARELRRAGQQDTLASIQIEIDNVRIAWQWAAGQGDAQGLVAASDGLFLFYEMRSWFQEGAEAFGQAAERFAEAAADTLDPTARRAYAKLLACAGWFTFHIGRQRRAHTMLGQSLDLMRDLGDPAAMVFPLNYLAAVTYHGGIYDAARALAEEALATSRTCGDQDGVAVAQTILGQIAYLVGDYRAARVHSEASLALERALGNRWGTVFTLISLGRVALAERAFAEARHWFSEGLAIRDALGDGRGIGLCLRYLGDIAAALGDQSEAQQLYQESLARFKAIGDQAGAATSLIKLGYNALALHQRPAARSSFFEALRAAWAIRATPETLEALAGIATVLAEDNPSQAYALATLVARHPAVTQESKDHAETLQSQLVSGGFAPASAALPDQNTGFALEPIVTTLLGAGL